MFICQFFTIYNLFNLHAVFDQLQMILHQTLATSIGPGAGITALGVFVGTKADFGMGLIIVIGNNIFTQQLMMNLGNIKAILLIEEFKLLKYTFHVAASNFVIGKDPLLKVLHMITGNIQFLDTFLAEGQQVFASFDFVGMILMGQGLRKY